MVKPYNKNAKKHPDNQLKAIAKSIKEFGWQQPIVVDKNDEIIVGHGRWFAYEKYGEEMDLPKPEIKKASNLTKQQVKAYRLADNKLNESDWDMDMAIEELRELDDYHFDLTGFDRDLLIEPDEKDDVIPENAPTRAKTGQIWQLGKHRVMCGDSTKKEDVEKLMDGKKADMCFTDPPYNVDYAGGSNVRATNKARRIQNDKMGDDQFYEFLYDSLKNMIDHCVGSFYVCMASKELHNLKKAFENAGGHWQSFIIWVKNNFTMGRCDYQQTYEPILYGWNEKHYFINERNNANVWEDLSKVKTEYDGKETTISFQGFKVKLKGKIEKGQVIRKKQHTDIWRHDKPTRSELHPTQKPVALILEAMTNSSKVNNIVLDTFLGSGSTLIACEKTNRICYGMELDPKYTDVIIQRYEDYTGNKAKIIGK